MSAVPAVLMAAWGAAWAPGCGSVTAYLQGPAPLAALPEPEVRLTVRERTEDGTLSAGQVVLAIFGPQAPAVEPTEVTGTVTRVVRGPAPRRGFRIEVEGSDRGAVLDVAPFREMPDLDLRAGAGAAIEARPVQGGVVVAVRDGEGEVFRLSAGRGTPGPGDQGEVEVHAMVREAYREVRSGEDLCRRTDVHRAVRARWGASEAVLDPGEARLLCAGDGRCRFVALSDARETEQWECGNADPERLVVWWSRVPPGTAAPP